MGVLNVTPDSFSDGGKFAATETAIAHGNQMFQDGELIKEFGEYNEKVEIQSYKYRDKFVLKQHKKPIKRK